MCKNSSWRSPRPRQVLNLCIKVQYPTAVEIPNVMYFNFVPSEQRVIDMEFTVRRNIDKDEAP